MRCVMPQLRQLLEVELEKSKYRLCKISNFFFYLPIEARAKQLLYKFLRSPSISYCFRHCRILSSFSMIRSLSTPFKLKVNFLIN